MSSRTKDGIRKLVGKLLPFRSSSLLPLVVAITITYAVSSL